MNVYDFDKTIYLGDSSIDFYFFCLKNNPRIIMRLPYQGVSFVLYKLGIINKKKFKETFFSFIKDFGNIDNVVGRFWDKHEAKICEWYLKQKKDNDLIISASPSFLLMEIVKRLKITNLIATDMEKNNGHINGENCYGIEKVKRFELLYSNTSITNFYSDSKSDLPMAMLAENSYIVNNKSKDLLSKFI